MESFSRRPPQLCAFRNRESKLMKLFPSIIALSVFTPLLHAQWVVTNPISDALSEIQHFEDIAKAVEMINNQVEQINTLTQQLQQIQAYVKAFGDPEQLLSIVGADELISSLGQSGVGQTISELQELATGVEALRYDANGLYGSLGETFTTPSGFQVPRAEKLYRKYGAIHQSSRNFQDVTDDVLVRREALRSEIAATPSSAPDHQNVSECVSRNERNSPSRYGTDPIWDGVGMITRDPISRRYRRCCRGIEGRPVHVLEWPENDSSKICCVSSRRQRE